MACTAGAHDRPFEERHHAACNAAVTEGTFQYRSTRGAAVLAPGAVLLGEEGSCFECGHERATGDPCLAFTPDHLEAIVAAVPGARQTMFAIPALPPLSSLVRLLATAEAACDDGDNGPQGVVAVEASPSPVLPTRPDPCWGWPSQLVVKAEKIA